MASTGKIELTRSDREELMMRTRSHKLTRIIHKNIALPGTSDRLSVSYQLNDANPDSSNLGMD